MLNRKDLFQIRIQIRRRSSPMPSHAARVAQKPSVLKIIMARLAHGAAVAFLSLGSSLSTAFISPIICPVVVQAKKPHHASSIDSDQSSSNAMEHVRLRIIGQNGSDFAAVTKELAVRAAEIEGLRRDLEEKDQAFWVATEALESNQKKLLGKISDLESALHEMQRGKTLAQENLGRMQKELSMALGRMSDLERQLSRSLGNLQKREMELSSTADELAAARSTIEKLRAELKQSAEERNSAAGITTTEKEEIPKLNGWYLDNDGAVMGTVTNHPEMDDGTTILTSPLVDPSVASAHSIVMTSSGSRYWLGDPLGYSEADRGAIKNADPADVDFGLTGEAVGDGKYLLVGKPKKSSAGRSQIWSAYRANADGLPTGEALAVKLSSNRIAMEREWGNYQRVRKGLTRGLFVSPVEFLPSAGRTALLAKKCALVMERGAYGDVKEYLERRGGGGLEGRALRDAALAAAQCIQIIHSSKLVWTDLKIENFVVVDDGGKSIIIKAIDLESAIERGGSPVDFSPESCPPEFAEAFLRGEGPHFPLDHSYDIWSYGTFLYELCTGQGLFDGKNPSEITHMLPTFQPKVDGSCIHDPKLMNLIVQCLQPDPKRRPNITQILHHPYFTTGFGPLGFLQVQPNLKVVHGPDTRAKQGNAHHP